MKNITDFISAPCKNFFKNAQNWYEVKTKCTIDQIIKKKSFFLSVIFKMKFKNNVCFNSTSKTLKYHLNVSQLSDQCYSGFLLSIPTKKSKHFFFVEIFFLGLQKNYISFGVEISKSDWVYCLYLYELA